MDCPSGGAEMERGILHTQRYPSWTGRTPPPVFRKPKDLVSLRPPDDKAAGVLDRDPFPEYPGAMLCRSCGLAAFPCKIVQE